VTHADLSGLAAAWNEIVVDGRGNAYVNQAGFDLMAGAEPARAPYRHCVRVREGGEVLQTITVDRGCFSCALGGPDGRTLFIVATEWRGPEGMLQGEPTGRVLTVSALAPHAGYPYPAAWREALGASRHTAGSGWLVRAA
jgi:sugar lactone lactonase YvrE